MGLTSEENRAVIHCRRSDWSGAGTHRAAGASRGFTLVEILVVVGILVLLVAILLPSLGYARRRARTAATAATIYNISVALESYKSDMGVYPRFAGTPPGGGVGSGYRIAPMCNWEFSILAEALTGWYDQGTGAWGTNSDGADGPGFRVTSSGEGRVYGPYLIPNGKNFKMYRSKEDLPNPVDPSGGTLTTNSGRNFGRAYSSLTASFIDAWGQPIFYYSADPRPTGSGQAVYVNKPVFSDGVNNAKVFIAGNPDCTNSSELYYTVAGTQVASQLVPFTPPGVWTADAPWGMMTGPAGDGNSPANTKVGYKFRSLIGLNDPTSNTCQLNDRIVGRNTFLLVAAGPDNLYFTGDEVLNDYAK